MRRPLMQSVFNRPQVSSRVLGTALMVGALVATLAALLLPVQLFGASTPAAAAGPKWDNDGGGTVNTPSGPLSALDRDFVRKVRLAGLWEQPAGRMAVERGTTTAVRTAGMHLIHGHAELNQLDIADARQLGITLPTTPTVQQQGWLHQIQGAHGAQFDRTFAQLVRFSHGKVFALIAAVRDRTENSVVRALATRANAVVLDHITVVENTGLVDFHALPTTK